MPELHELVYVYNKKIIIYIRDDPDCMEFFTGTFPVKTESWPGIVPVNNLFQNKSS